jgi:hypothetical protein
MNETETARVQGLEVQQPSPGQGGQARATDESAAATAPHRRPGKRHSCGRPKTDGSGPCPTPVAGPGKACPMHDDSPEGRARMALARQQGGKAARVKLGLDGAVVDGITLADNAGQLQVLTAATKALALGRITSTAATAIAQLVRTAAGIVATDQAAAIAALEARVEELIAGRVITSRR